MYPSKFAYPQEGAMKVTTKKVGSHVVRWFRRLNQEKTYRYRWYEVDNCGLH